MNKNIKKTKLAKAIAMAITATAISAAGTLRGIRFGHDVQYLPGLSTTYTHQPRRPSHQPRNDRWLDLVGWSRQRRHHRCHAGAVGRNVRRRQALRLHGLLSS